MSSSNLQVLYFNNCNCDGCNVEQLFLYKSLLKSSDSHYEVLESFVLYLWNHSEFNQLHNLYAEFLSERFPSMPEHLPFSARFFDDGVLSSQTSFRGYDESRNSHPENYPISPSPESFGLESSSHGKGLLVYHGCRSGVVR